MDMRESTKRQRKAVKQSRTDLVAPPKSKEDLTTLRHAAVQNDSASCVRTDALHRSDEEATSSMSTAALHLAAERNLVDVVKSLLQDGADVNARDEHSFTPLHVAISRGATDAIQILLENGADPNSACSNEAKVHYVNRLCEGGVDRNSDWLLNLFKSPLHLAVCCSVKQDETATKIVSLLLRYGAVVDCDNSPCTLTALFYAVRNGLSKTVRVLLDHGARIELINAIDLYGFCHYVRGHPNAIRSMGRWYCKTVFEVIRHIERLIVIETRVFPDYMSFYEDFFQTLRTHCNNDKVKKVLLMECGFSATKYRQECHEELTKMQTVRVSCYNTLYDIFRVDNAFVLSRFVANINFQQIVKSNDLSENFPNYAFLLRWLFRGGSKLQMLYETCEKSLEILGLGKVNKLITDKIVQYLNQSDLKNLSEIQ